MEAGVREEPAQGEAGGTKMGPPAAFVGLRTGHTERAPKWGKGTKTGVPIRWGYRAIGRSKINS